MISMLEPLIVVFSLNAAVVERDSIRPPRPPTEQMAPKSSNPPDDRAAQREERRAKRRALRERADMNSDARRRGAPKADTDAPRREPRDIQPDAAPQPRSGRRSPRFAPDMRRRDDDRQSNRPNRFGPGDLFNWIDRNGDGVIDRREFNNAAPLQRRMRDGRDGKDSQAGREGRGARERRRGPVDGPHSPNRAGPGPDGMPGPLPGMGAMRLPDGTPPAFRRHAGPGGDGPGAGRPGVGGPVGPRQAGPRHDDRANYMQGPRSNRDGHDEHDRGDRREGRRPRPGRPHDVE